MAVLRCMCGLVRRLKLAATWHETHGTSLGSEDVLKPLSLSVRSPQNSGEKEGD